MKIEALPLRPQDAPQTGHSTAPATLAICIGWKGTCKAIQFSELLLVFTVGATRWVALLSLTPPGGGGELNGPEGT